MRHAAWRVPEVSNAGCVVDYRCADWRSKTRRSQIDGNGSGGEEIAQDANVFDDWEKQETGEDARILRANCRV